MSNENAEEIMTAMVALQPSVEPKHPMGKPSKAAISKAIKDTNLVAIDLKHLMGVRDMGEIVEQMGVTHVGRGFYISTMDGLLLAIKECNDSISQINNSEGEGVGEIMVSLQQLRAELLAKAAEVGEKLVKSRPPPPPSNNQNQGVPSFPPGASIPIVAQNVSVVVKDDSKG